MTLLMTTNITLLRNDRRTETKPTFMRTDRIADLIINEELTSY